MKTNSTRAGTFPGAGLAIGAMVLSAACWGLATVMTKGALAEIPPFALLASQLTASVTFLWLAVTVTGNRVRLDGKARRAALTGLLEPGLAYGVGVPGLALTTAASASVIGAAEPAFIILVAWLCLGVRPNVMLMLAILVAMAGIGLVTLPGLPGLGAGDPRGDLLVLLGTLFAALYVVSSGRLVVDIAPVALAALQQSVGLGFSLALLSGALLLGFETLPETVTLEIGLLALASGVVQYALAFWFYLIGIKVLPVGVAGLFLTLIPVFGVGGAMVFLGESIAPLQAIGAALILAAVLAIARRGFSDGLAAGAVPS